MKRYYAKSRTIRGMVTFLIVASILVSCDNSTQTLKPSGSNPVNLGTAPNGSKVMASASNFTATQDGAAAGVIKIIGGEGNTDVTITFASANTPFELNKSALRASGANTVIPNGISVATDPSPCKLTTSGVHECEFTATVAAFTKPGTYLLNLTATDNTGAAVNLRPLSLTVSSNNIPAIVAANSLGVSGSIVAGQTFTVTAKSVNGGTDTINFANESTISYSPTSCYVAANGSCATTVTVGSTTLAGQYTVKSSAVNGSKLFLVGESFAVTAAPPIAISNSLISGSAIAGQKFTITAKSVNGDEGTVNFANVNSSDNNNISYSPTSCYVAANDSCTVTATVAATAPRMAYATQISSSTAIVLEDMRFVVVNPALTVILQPSPVITHGSKTTSTTQASFSMASVPAGYNATIVANIFSTEPTVATVSPSTCIINVADGVATPCLVTVSAVSTKVGKTIIQATAQGFTGATSNEILVTDQALIIVYSPPSIFSGQTFTLTATSINAGEGTVNFANVNSSDNNNISYSPTSCTVPAYGLCTTTVSTAIATPVGSYSTRVTRTGDTSPVVPETVTFSVVEPQLKVEDGQSESSIGWTAAGNPESTTLRFVIKSGQVPAESGSLTVALSTTQDAVNLSESTCTITYADGAVTGGTCAAPAVSVISKVAGYNTTIQAAATGFTTATSNTIKVNPAINLAQTGQTPTQPITAASGYDGYTYFGVPWAYPLPTTLRFTSYPDFTGGSCLIDSLTGLIWQQDGVLTPIAWQTALDNSAARNSCGLANWRLPNFNELLSLVNYGAITNQSEWLGTQGFSNISAAKFWTSSTWWTDSTLAWVLDMGNAAASSAPKTGTFYTLYVHDSVGGNPPVALPQTGQTPTSPAPAAVFSDGALRKGSVWPIPRFVLAPGNSACIVDNLTGLMWQQSPSLTQSGWSDALTTAGGLPDSLCNYNDWRLPNVRELLSLINLGSTLGSGAGYLNANGFTNVQQGIYWTSSPAVAAGNAWGINMGSSAGSIADPTFAITQPNYVWFVRGGQSN